MFDIGFSELLIIFVIALIVLGPERLPTAARYLGSLFGKIRNTWQGVQMEIERELHLEELKKQAQQMKDSVDTEYSAAKQTLEDAQSSIHTLSDEAQDELNQLADVIEAKQSQQSAPPTNTHVGNRSNTATTHKAKPPHE